MDKLAQEDHPFCLSKEELLRYKKTLVSHTKQIGQKCTDATSTRLPSCSHNHEPPPPRTRRRTCRTYSFSTIPKMAPFFLKFFMVELGHAQKLVELMSSIHFSSVCCGRFRLQLIALCCNRGVCKQYTSHVNFSSSENALIDEHHTAWLKCWCTLRLIRTVIHACDLIVCSLLIPHLVRFRVFLLSLLLLPEPGL